MKDIIVNVFAVVGVFAIIITIGMFLLIIIEDIRDYIRITKHRMKREYEKIIFGIRGYVVWRIR